MSRRSGSSTRGTVAHLRPSGDRRRTGRPISAGRAAEDRKRGVAVRHLALHNAQVHHHRTGTSIRQRDDRLLADIPVNAYDKTIEEELANYSAEDLLHIWQRHVRDPRVRDRSSTRSRPRAPTRASTYNHAGPAHLSIGQEAAAVGMAFSLDARRPHLRLASQPRRDSGQGVFRDPSAERRRAAARSCGRTATARCSRPVERGYSGNGPGPGGPLLRLRRVQRDLRARNRLQSRARRLDARLLRAVRHLSEQRDRRRVGIDRAGRGALQARQPEAGHRRGEHRRLVVRLRPGLGRHHASRRWTSTARCGIESLGGGLPIIFNCMNNFYGMGGQPFGETMGVRVHRAASAPASTRSRCTPSASTATIRCPVIDAFRRKKQVLLRGPRAGPARYGHVPHQRPLAVRRVELPVEGRDRALAAGRFDPRVPRASWSTHGVAADDGARRGQSGDRRDDLRHVPAGRGPGGQPARGRRFRAGRRR